MDPDKLTEWLLEMFNDIENTPPEVIRFIEELLIKVEFGHFEPDES